MHNIIDFILDMLLNPLLRFTTKPFINRAQKILEKSHKIFLKRRQEPIWRRISDEIEICIDTYDIFDPLESYAELLIKLGNNTSIISGEIVVKAKNGNAISWDNKIELEDVKNRLTCFKLTNFPKQEIISYDPKGIIFSYDNIEIMVKNLILSNGKVIEKLNLKLIPTCFDILNAKFFREWNIDFLEHERNDFRNQIVSIFPHIELLFFFNYVKPKNISEKLKLILVKLLTWEPVSIAIFYSFLYFGIFKIIEDKDNENKVICSIKYLNHDNIRKFLRQPDHYSFYG